MMRRSFSSADLNCAMLSLSKPTICIPRTGPAVMLTGRAQPYCAALSIIYNGPISSPSRVRSKFMWHASASTVIYSVNGVVMAAAVVIRSDSALSTFPFLLQPLRRSPLSGRTGK